MGEYNFGVGVLRRGKTTPGAPIGRESTTSTSPRSTTSSRGTGTLLTGGTVSGTKAVAQDNPIHGRRWPEQSGHVPAAGAAPARLARRRVIIPPGVYHGFDEVTDGIDYLAVRPDPHRVLQAGFVHPAIKK
jgi:hypothetical protein